MKFYNSMILSILSLSKWFFNNENDSFKFILKNIKTAIFWYFKL